MNENEHPLSYIFHEINQVYMNNVKQEASLMGINPTYRYIFMCLIANKEGLSQTKLCEFVHLKAPSVSLILQQMEKDDLIIREKSSDDNRMTIVKLTEKGKKLDMKLRQVFKKHDELMKSALDEQEMKNLHLYLDKIIVKLKGVNENV